MALGGDRFGLGVNWLQQLAGADDDQGRASPVRGPDLPPMFRPGRCVHSGEQAVKIQVDVGSLGVGEKFSHEGVEYEVMRNGGGKYVHVHGTKIQANTYLPFDEEVEVERESD